jgi:hypothetical protein
LLARIATTVNDSSCARLSEIARVLVWFGHFARFIENANHSTCGRL